MFDKSQFSERDICIKFITSALANSGWDVNLQVLEEVSFTAAVRELEKQRYQFG